VCCYRSLQSQIWIVVRIAMLLITNFVELRVVAGRSRTRAGGPQTVSRRPCCVVALRRTAWSEHGMASVNQTRPHCVNQMGKIHSRPLGERHVMCESAFSVQYNALCKINTSETYCISLRRNNSLYPSSVNVTTGEY
jgi:hypothetical protein